MHFLRQTISLKPGESLSWRLMKLPLVLVWLNFIRPILGSYHAVPLPAGICAYIPCDFFRWEPVGIAVGWLALVLAVLYVLEYRMRVTTLLIALVSLFVFSLEESNGIYARTAILSAVFCAQFLAYMLRNRPYADPASFSRQIIAASYTLAGLSKLLKTGFTWPLDARYLLLQIKKGAYYGYYDRDDITGLSAKQEIIDFFSQHQSLLLVGLLCSFALELCSFVILINTRTAFWYGVLLCLMHIGISYTMDIVIYPIVYPMVIILLNPLNIPVDLYRKIRGQVSPEPIPAAA